VSRSIDISAGVWYSMSIDPADTCAADSFDREMLRGGDMTRAKMGHRGQ